MLSMGIGFILQFWFLTLISFHIMKIDYSQLPV